MHRSRSSLKSKLVIQLLVVFIFLPSWAGDVHAQSVFPLPGWFRDNIGRPTSPEKNKALSDYLNRLSQDGKLGLTEGDAIRLVLENNLDVVVDRYDPRLAQFDIERAYNLFDPKLQFTLSTNRSELPLQTNFITGVNSLSTLEHTTNFSFSQLFQTGTQYQIQFQNQRISSNNLRNFVNPSLYSSMQATITQPLLRNFGLLPNTRLIRINRNNQDISEYLFAQRVIELVNQAQNLYWDLVFAREDIKVKQRSLDLATKTNEDNKRQVEIGTLAPIEVVKSESEIANRREELIRSQYNLEQMEDQMKKLISSFGDPAEIQARIEPLDQTLSPSAFKDFDLAQAVSYAIEARPEIKQIRKQIENGEIDVRYFRNQLLPRADVSISYGTNALAGTKLILLPDGRSIQGATTGFSDNLRTLFGSDFAGYSAAITVEIPIKNRAGQADFARALLAKRQVEQNLKAWEQRIALEVRNAHTQLEMNRARIDATKKARELAERNLEAEQKKFQLGTSTIRFVLEEQRNLSVAQSNELQSLVDFTKAKDSLDKAMGRTLEVNNVRIDDALAGAGSGRASQNTQGANKETTGK
jgi:outer membrane protein